MSGFVHEHIAADGVQVMRPGFVVDRTKVFFPQDPLADDVTRIRDIVYANEGNPDLDVSRHDGTITVMLDEPNGSSRYRITCPSVTDPRPHIYMAESSPEKVNSAGQSYELAWLGFAFNTGIAHLMMDTESYPLAVDFEVPDHGYPLFFDTEPVQHGVRLKPSDHYIKSNQLRGEDGYYIEVVARPSAFGPIARVALEGFIAEVQEALAPYDSLTPTLPPQV